MPAVSSSFVARRHAGSVGWTASWGQVFIQGGCAGKRHRPLRARMAQQFLPNAFDESRGKLGLEAREQCEDFGHEVIPNCRG